MAQNVKSGEQDFLTKKRLELERLQSELTNIQGNYNYKKTEQKPADQTKSFQEKPVHLTRSFQKAQKPVQQKRPFATAQQQVQKPKQFTNTRQNITRSNFLQQRQVQKRTQQQRTQISNTRIHTTKRYQSPKVAFRPLVKKVIINSQSVSMLQNQRQGRKKNLGLFFKRNYSPMSQSLKPINSPNQNYKTQQKIKPPPKRVQKIPLNLKQFYQKQIESRRTSARPSTRTSNLNRSVRDQRKSSIKKDTKYRSSTPQSSSLRKSTQDTNFEIQDQGRNFQELSEQVGINLANEYKRLFQKNAGANSTKLNLMQFRKFVKENQLNLKVQGSVDIMFYKFSSQSNCLNFKKFMNFIFSLSEQKFKQEKVQKVQLQRLLQENLVKQRKHSPRTIELQKVYTELYQPSIQVKIEKNKSKVQMIYQQITKKLDYYDVQQQDIVNFFKTLKVIPDFISQSQLIKLYTTLSNPMFTYNSDITLLETMIYIISLQSYNKVFTNTKLQTKGEKYDQFVNRMGKQFISFSRLEN